MKRILTRVLAALLVVGGLVAVLWPVENWRMYDANWQPLALTQAEAYCAGYTSSVTGVIVNEQDETATEACMAETKHDNEKPSIGAAVRMFCTGIAAHIDFPIDDCIGQVEGYDIWPVLNGGYTFEWNESNKRPEVVQSDLVNAPRRAGRDDDSRDSGGRLGD